MYADHVPVIAKRAMRSPQALADTAMFAIVTARVQFMRVPAMMRELRERGAAASCLWGWKRDSYLWLREHKEAFWADVTAASDGCACIEALLAMPGLGLVKSGFVAQMLGHNVACMDTRNIAVLGIKPRDVYIHKAAPEATRRDRVFGYVELTQRTGDAEYWWDTWCTQMALDTGRTPDAISAMHVRLTKGPY